MNNTQANKSLSLLLGGLSALALLLPASVVAAPDTKEENREDSIIVTALRTPQPLAQLPSAATVLDRARIEAHGSLRLVDLIKDQAGVAIARSGGVGGQSQLRMRGGEANHTLVLINGVRANDPAGADELLWEHLKATEVERIEIIRGPQSALWGSDAMAGVVNIVTRQGEEGISGRLHGEYGSFATYRLGGGLSGGTDKVSLSVGADYVDSRGSNVSRQDAEKDGYDNLSLSARGGFAFSDTVRLDAFARHMDATNEFDPIDWATGLPSDGDRVTKTRNTHLGVALKADLWGGRINQQFQFGYTDTSNENFANCADDGTTAADVLVLSSQTGIRLAEGHQMTLAVDYTETDYRQRGLATPWGDPNQDQSMDNLGLLTDYVWTPDDRLSLSASVRHDDNSDFRNITTWRTGVSYQAAANTRLRAAAGTGQKAPTFTERFGFFSDQFLGNPDLTPERATHFEGGIDQDLANGQARIAATFFYTKLKNEIDGFVFDLDSFLFTAANKDNKSRRLGLELDAGYTPSGNWLIAANYTWTKAQEQDAAGNWQPELRRPRHAGSIFIQYSWAEGASVNLNASFTGDADDMFFPPWPLQAEMVTLKNYVLVSVSAEVPLTEHVSVTGRIENAFDDSYEDVFGFANPGIGAYIGLKGNF